ncbi:BamA/TamA family outer membrane protein [Formosa haliotis]|uniref:BamA/TamA family outer membrane protein n=1 Tax=Formosa haliotis TaxID=1555194 RepID=UPI000826FACA|nr:BamA/TamA family outer membrane protein [Formosa haliotis]
MKYFVSVCIILFLSVVVHAQQAKPINDSISKSEIKKDRKIKTVIIPTITYNNSFGTIFGVMASGFYKTKKNDSISPLSKTTFVANYSTNKTWYAVLPSKFYFNEDRHRATVVLGVGSVNFQTYVDWGDFLGDLPQGIFNLPEGGEFVDYNNAMQFAMVEFMTETYKKLYVGARVLYSHNITTFDVPLKQDEELSQLGVGVSSVYDTRDDQMRPLKGMNVKFNTMTFLQSLGSTNDYTNINFEFNKYYPLQERNTILLRTYGQVAVGDVPFAGQNVVGRDDLRGYSNGKYRADQVYDIQTAYRHSFANKWGYVAFAGVATAINGASDISLDNTLPAVGAGIRYMAIPKAKINIGVDAAIGRDDWGVYFRIGEAFTR